MNLNRQKGIAQLVVLGVMAFLALGLPLTTKVVQQNQENRSQAAAPVCKCSRTAYKNISTCTRNGGKWNCTYSTPTRVPTKKPVPTRVPTKKPVPTRVPTKKPVPTRVPTKKPSCISGLRRCSGNATQECVNGQWKTAENCTYGCFESRYEGARCHNVRVGSKKCSSDFKNFMIYDKSGEWIVDLRGNEPFCNYGCNPKTLSCFGSPIPYTACSTNLYPISKKICFHNEYYYRCDNGVWKPTLNKDGTRQKCTPNADAGSL